MPHVKDDVEKKMQFVINGEPLREVVEYRIEPSPRRSASALAAAAAMIGMYGGYADRPARPRRPRKVHRTHPNPTQSHLPTTADASDRQRKLAIVKRQVKAMGLTDKAARDERRRLMQEA